MKFFIALLFSSCLLCVSYSQDISTERNSSTIYIGYPFGYFDSPDLGFYVGYNEEFSMKSRFSWEGQGAFTYGNYKRDSDTFAHDGGSTYGIGLLVGPRLYIMKPERTTRIYLNTLLGPAYIFNSEFRNDGVSPEEFLSEEHLFTLGYSLGAYLQVHDKFLIGTALESGAFQILKLGYKF